MKISPKNNNQLKTRIIALIFGFFLNVFGNSLTVVANAGAEPWTAAAVNVQKTIGLTVGLWIIIFGVAGAILNQFLLKKKHLPRFLEEVFYIFCFGYIMDGCNWILTKIGIQNDDIIIRSLLSISGVTLFCVAISIYQRANIFMHPNDDTSNLLRFRFLGGSAIKSQLLDIIPAFIIIGICWPFLGTVYSVNIGTIYSLICNGIIIKHADKHIWPKLVHNYRRRYKYF